MKKVVITGATSFVGFYLLQEWLKRECDIYIIVRPNSKNLSRLPKDSHINIIELEMYDYDKIPQYITNANILYHLSWEGTRFPYRDNFLIQKRNYDCAIKLIKSAQKIGISLFIGSGSQAEYGKMKGPVNEDYPCNPITEYGKWKLKTFETLKMMAKEFGIKFIWTRIFSLYGKYDYDKSLVMSCIDKMSKNEPVQVSMCTQKWDYLYVEEAAEILVKFAEIECESGVYNVASGSIKPLKNYVEEIKQVLNSTSIINYNRISYEKSECISLEPVIKKMETALQWKSKVNFFDAIQKIYRNI